MDGKPATTAAIDMGTGGIAGDAPLRIGMGESNFAEVYVDEARVLNGSLDTPQIKWTHTQTAGAGNKDAYDVHGWRAHGHEFSDDNATTLLAHGDSAYTGLKKATSFDGTVYASYTTNNFLVAGGKFCFLTNLE